MRSLATESKTDNNTSPSGSSVSAGTDPYRVSYESLEDFVLWHHDSRFGGQGERRDGLESPVSAEREAPRLGMEAQITAKFMKMHGIQNVRGAMFSMSRNLTHRDTNALVGFLGHYNDESYPVVRGGTGGTIW